MSTEEVEHPSDDTYVIELDEAAIADESIQIDEKIQQFTLTLDAENKLNLIEIDTSSQSNIPSDDIESQSQNIEISKRSYSDSCIRQRDDQFLNYIESSRLVVKFNEILKELSLSFNVLESESKVDDGRLRDRVMFFCGICMTECSDIDMFKVSSCPLQSAFCHNCMSGYITCLINSGQIQFRCPCSLNCGFVNDFEINRLVDHEMQLKYQRLKKLRKDPNYRECPKCFIGTVSHDLASLGPDITCENCGLIYCYHHSNAHEGKSCEAYLKNMSWKKKRQIQASEALLNFAMKKCPACGAATEKNGGCNHMTCQHCKVNWCWLCGSQIDDVSWHYKPTNVMGCPGSQHLPTLSICPCLQFMFNNPVYKIFRFIILLALFLALFVPVAIVMSPFTCCFLILKHDSNCCRLRHLEKFFVAVLLFYAFIATVIALVLDLINMPLWILYFAIKQDLTWNIRKRSLTYQFLKAIG